MSQAIVIITTLTLLSKGMGFVRDIIIAYFFGTSSTMDSFLASQNPLNLISGIVMGTFAAAFLPLFVRVYKQRGQEEAERYSSTIFYSALLILSGLVLLTAIFAPEVVRVFLPGFTGKEFDLTVKFLRWMSLATVITSIVSFLSALLRGEKKFLAYPLVGLGFDFVIIGVLFLTRHYGDISLALAWTAGPVFMLMILGFAERRFLNPLKVSRKIPETRDLYKMIAPLLFSSALSMLNTIVDRSFASGLETGAISSLTYAGRVNGAASGILGAPIGQVAYPSIASHVAENDMNGLLITVKKSMKLLAFFLIPISFAFFPLAKGIIGILFQRGNFTAESTLLTYPPLMAASVSLFTMSFNTVLTQVYYSFKNSKTPMFYGVFGIGINIGLNFLFIGPLKQTGLALSTSISSFFFTTALLLSLKKKYDLWFFDLWYFTKILISSFIMMGGIYAVMVSVHGRIRYVIGGLVGLGVYYVLSRIFGTLPKHFLRYLKFKKAEPDKKDKVL